MEQREVLPPMWIGIQPPENLAPERYAAQVQCQPCFLQPYLVVPSKGGQRLRIAISSHIAGEPSFAISIQNGHKQDGTRVTCPIRPLCSKKCPTYTAHGPCTYQFPDQHHTGTENFTATHMHHHQ